MRKTREYKLVPLGLKSGKTVPITDVKARSARGTVKYYEAQIREEMKDTPPQSAREYQGISTSIYQALRIRLKKDFNTSYKPAEQLMWVWKGIGLQGD